MLDNIRRLLYTQEYYRNLDFYIETKNKVLKRLVKRFCSEGFGGPGAVALDIGCGRGELVYRLSKDCSRVYGLDYSENALSFSKKNISGRPEYIKNKICLLCADASQLPFKNNTINCVFSIDVFEHIRGNGLKSLVEEMYRVLKEKGKFIIFTSPNKEYADIGYRYWIKPINIIFNPISRALFKKELMIIDHYGDPTHINLHTVKSLRQLFSGQGFKVHIYTRWLIPDNFIGFLYKIIAYLWPITLFYPMRNLFCPFLWIEGKKMATNDNLP